MFKAVTVWAPGGYNTAVFSYGLAMRCSRYLKVIIVELPCLGIPRLGFAADIMDRVNHSEAAILELEKKGELSLEYVHKKGENMAVLPACVFAVPELPVVQKVKLETLIGFPRHFIDRARRCGYELVIFECQGQLTCPMTFFAIKDAEKVVIPVKEPADAAFSLINIKRLVEIFKYNPGKFLVVCDDNADEFAEIMTIRNEESEEIFRIKVLARSDKSITDAVLSMYGCHDVEGGQSSVYSKKKYIHKENLLSRVLDNSIFKKYKKAHSPKTLSVKPFRTSENNEQAEEESWKIKI